MMRFRVPRAWCKVLALALGAACVVLGAMPVEAHAQGRSTRAKAKTALTFLAGGVTGLTVHEAGHVTAAVVFGANPGTKPIRYAGIPFFAVTHDPVTRPREFVISSAGFWIHHAGSEWILTARPRLVDESAPFLKGMLAFNIGTSVMYSGAAVLKVGPPERDPLGMANSLGRRGWPEPVIGVLILGPAVLDAYRFVKPGHAWAAWTSRGLKAALMALVVFTD